MRTMIFGAGTDLGVHIDGANLGPVQLMNDLKSFYQGESMLLERNKDIIKSRNLSDRRKNEYEIENYNSSLYKAIVEKIKEECFPITIGGDHTVSIASALASAKVNIDVGLIWIDAHTNYHTFDTTVDGNIDTLSLAAINGYKNNELRYYHDGKIIQPSRCVVIGARSIDDAEKDNVRYSGITVFSTEDVREKGIEAVMDEAFKIAGYKTKGIKGAIAGAKTGLAIGGVTAGGVGTAVGLAKTHKDRENNRFINKRLDYAQKQARRREQRDWYANNTGRVGYSYSSPAPQAGVGGSAEY